MARDFVRIFEVGVRDGLQNEPMLMSTRNKIWLVRSLLEAGVIDLELGAFVSHDRVPQMADTAALYAKLRALGLGLAPEVSDAPLKLRILDSIHAGPVFWALVPNRRGLHQALKAGVTHIAVFTGATETFVRKNIGMSIGDSLAEFKALIQDARQALGPRLKIRGYVSTAFGCPFEGKVSPKQALKVIEKLYALGVDEISVGDTIGVATPFDVDRVIRPALRVVSAESLAVHFHDTRGTALANTLRAMDLGVRTVDASAGGLGGCPFAPGAAGNLATEDLVYMLNGMNIKTGINLGLLSEVSLKVFKILKRAPTSRYLQSVLSSKNRRKKLKLAF